MISDNNNADTSQEVTQKCPFCHKGLIIKNNLLFCPKCDLFIGDPKSFTGSLPTNDTIDNDVTERAKEREAKKRGNAIWQVAIAILILIVTFTIYQFKLWTFVIGIDYSSVKELQKDVPFTIYLPKKIPFGYSLDEESTDFNYAKSGKIDSIDFVYKKMGGDIINISLFPIDTGFTQNNKTAEELFLSLSSGKSLNKSSLGGQDTYTSESELILAENNTKLYQSISVIRSDNFMAKIEYIGSVWLTEDKIKSIAGSLRPIGNL